MNGVNVFNYIRENSSRAFQDYIPEATEDNIATLGSLLLANGYQPMLNEFVNNLINRIAYTIVNNKMFSNPLARFRKGTVPLGTDIQELYENPAEVQTYEYSDIAMAKLLTITDPDTKVAYYRRNRQDMYTKTITREGLQGAFVSWDNFISYINSITQSLYNGNYIDEFKYTKQLVKSAFQNEKVQYVKITDVTDESSAKAFVKKCRELYGAMQFPSTEYNAYSLYNEEGKTVTTWTDPSRICIMIKNSILATVDVDVLASAFNMDKANFMGAVYPVDDFGDDSIMAVIFDESWLQIHNQIFKFDEFYNARVMAYNEYLHVWDIFAISPFANAIVIANDDPELEVNTIKLSGNKVTMDVSTTDTSITVTVIPKDGDVSNLTVSAEEELVTPTLVETAEDGVYTLSLVGGATDGEDVVTIKTVGGKEYTVNVTLED